MGILINKDTKVIVQGFTGKKATFHIQECMKYGTNVVAGVTPFKGGTTHLDKPVFNTIKEALEVVDATVSIIFVPPFAVKDSIIEAADAGIKLAVVITENTPIKDMMFAKSYANEKNMKIIGPNCPGIITAGECKLGIMPSEVFVPGCVGIISKSGTLTYEAAKQVLNYGVSTAVGMGGDFIIGMDYVDFLREFEKDDKTKVIIMIGEIGGDLEIKAADFIKDNITKPVIAFIAGATAPKGKRMGHAGAIISNNNEDAKSKKEILKNSGVYVVDSPIDIEKTLKNILKNERF